MMAGHRTSISVRQLNRCLAAARREGERPFATIERYWNDPEYADALEAERNAEQAKLNARIDAAMERARERRTGA